MTTSPGRLQAVTILAVLTLRMALRERLARAMALMIALSWAATWFLASLLVSDETGPQAAMLGFLLRLGSVFLTMVTVTFSLTRDLQNRGLELLLALPYPRGAIWLGKGVGFAMIASLLALLDALALMPLAPPGQALLWGVAINAELWLMATLAMLLTLALRQAPLALTMTAALYLLGRSMHSLLLIARQSAEMATEHWSAALARHLLTLISWLLPDLERFTVTDWLLHHGGSLPALGPIFAETLLYLALLMAVGHLELRRRAF
ncbi:MAG: ABC transporter permease [Magnetococcales bacterium]|nr:ABC transporter permease [Magnetococcales bacterium]